MYWGLVNAGDNLPWCLSKNWKQRPAPKIHFHVLRSLALGSKSPNTYPTLSPHTLSSPITPSLRPTSTSTRAYPGCWRFKLGHHWAYFRWPLGPPPPSFEPPRPPPPFVCHQEDLVHLHLDSQSSWLPVTTWGFPRTVVLFWPPPVDPPRGTGATLGPTPCATIAPRACRRSARTVATLGHAPCTTIAPRACRRSARTIAMGRCFQISDPVAIWTLKLRLI